MAKEKLEKSIRREEEAAMAEYYYLQQLRQAIYTRDVKKTRSLIKYLGKIERRLWRYHKVANRELDILEKKYFNNSPRMRELQTRVNVFAKDVLARISDLAEDAQKLTGTNSSIGYRPDYKNLQDKAWAPLEEAVITLENDIRAWEILDKQLLQTGIDIIAKGGDKGEGPESAGALEGAGTVPEKILALLIGRGEYRAYSQEQRRKIWNRYQLSVKERVLHYVNLAGADLSGFEFYNFVFVKSNLDKANFTGASLLQCEFSHCSGEGTIFDGANMQSVQFRGESTGITARHVRPTFDGARFVEADLRNAVFVSGTCRYAMRKTNFDGADLRGATLYGIQFDGTSFTAASLEGATITNCLFREKAVFHKTNFSRATLEKDDFSGAYLRSAVFAGARGTSLVWGGGRYNEPFADVTGADLSFDYLRPKDAAIEQFRSLIGLDSIPEEKYPLNFDRGSVGKLQHLAQFREKVA